jgi:hypothetical protein
MSGISIWLVAANYGFLFACFALVILAARFVGWKWTLASAFALGVFYGLFEIIHSGQHHGIAITFRWPVAVGLHMALFTAVCLALWTAGGKILARRSR